MTHAFRRIKDVDSFVYRGRISRVVGMMLEAVMPNATIGDTCAIHPSQGEKILAEIVGLNEGRTILMPLGPCHGLTVGTPVTRSSSENRLQVGRGLLGRVLDGLGRPLDGQGALEDVCPAHLTSTPINPLERRGVERPLNLGIKAINGLLTVGEGQRIAIVAGAGVGKSTLLGMMARNTEADVAVVALIGERGREVQEFVHNDLKPGHAGSSHVTVVSATADESPAMRLRAAFTATAIAEFFRDQGLRVLLLMDSLTRVVMAQREIGLSVGEPPATRGYPPSAFQMIPKLLERTGMGRNGSITAVYTTLITGDDPDDPIGDAVRGTTDGHIVLSRRIAQMGHYPAISITESISRVMDKVVPSEHLDVAREFRRLLVNVEDAEELVSLGAYRKGENPAHDRALSIAPVLRSFLSQTPTDAFSLEDSFGLMKEAVQAQPRESSHGFTRDPSRSYLRPLKERK